MTIKRAASWPPPVYVARFSDGTVCRMSCGDYRPKSKATGYDFDKGRRVACNAVGFERDWKARIKQFVDAGEGTYGVGIYHPDDIARWRAAHGKGNATDIISGHFEHDGRIIPDPYFEPAAAPEKHKAIALDRLIASIKKLTPADRDRVLDALAMAEAAD